MAWPPSWNLNAAWQQGIPAFPYGNIQVLEDWRDNHVIPWGQRADNQLQDHGRRIHALEQHRVNKVNPLLSRIPGMENRIDALEGQMGKVEMKRRENSQAVNSLDRKMNQVIEGTEKRPEKLGQQRGGLGGGLGGEFGGDEYANGQNAYQQDFINMIHQQQQLDPVMPWGGFPLPPPAPAPAPAPAPSCECRINHSPYVHIQMGVARGALGENSGEIEGINSRLAHIHRILLRIADDELI